MKGDFHFMSECRKIPPTITNYSTKSIVTALVGTKATTRGKFIEIPWLTVKNGVYGVDHTMGLVGSWWEEGVAKSTV